MATNILVVEDEAAIQELVCFALESQGFETRRAASVTEARRELEAALPDLLLLDLMLPDGDGLSLLRELRRTESTRQLPAIMLTARADEADRVAGLDGGCDDYVGKPFSPRELVSRVRALLRVRKPERESQQLSYGPIQIDSARHETSVGGRAIRIGFSEFKLLKFLVGHPERVFSRAQLLGRVWGDRAAVDERTVDVHILRLRKTLASANAQHLVQTVRGLGYRLSARA